MLSVEDNEVITRVGPGTLMGNFMREYWLPAMLSSEVPEPDGDPVRVKMLGEELIGFRDTSGQVGLITNYCPHRGTSLYLGRNEDNGIRCVYHGWKFDRTGACVDMPSEPPESRFKGRVRATAYPCQELAGFVWVYMGSREIPPPLPGIEASLTEGMVASAQAVPCNWLQTMEGNIDTIHGVFLHGGAAESDWFPEGSFDYYQFQQRWAKFVSADTDYGSIYGAYRPGPPGMNYWRIGHFMFPCWSSPPTGILGHKIEAKCWVPIDDTHTIVFRLDAPREGAEVDGAPKSREKMTVLGPMTEEVPRTTDWYGRFNRTYTWENDFLMDREEQRELGSFTGMVFGANNEDSAVQVTMGEIVHREIEHLGTTDTMVIRVRQRLLDAARAFEKGEGSPPALDTPEVYAARTGSVFIPEDANWREYTAPLTKAFVDHGDPDPTLEPGPGLFGSQGRRHRREGPFF